MDDKKEILLKEIDLIQSCISRMAQNSFAVKGWAITLVAVVLALLPESVDIKLLCMVGIIATTCFWYLDAFFLKSEKLYRWKYEWVIANRMSSEVGYYDLNPYNENMWNPNKEGNTKKEPWVVRMMFTKTLMPIYLPLLVLSIVFFIIECIG